MMLAGILCLYFTTGSLSMVDIMKKWNRPYSGSTGDINFLSAAGGLRSTTGFSVTYMVTDAHTDAPTA